MESIESRVDSFVNQWEYYYYPDKNQKCRPHIESFIKEIDQLLEAQEQTKKEKAKLFYLRGKILDALPTYEKSAQQFLNKSIKLNPINGDCWNCLAHVLFKKKDYQGAQKALEMALDNKGKNKVSLRYRSVLLRVQGSKYCLMFFIDLEQERRKNCEQSVKIIKQALMLDMKDPATWYFLGNAYLSNFFTNFKKVDELQNAFKAYNQAQKYFKHRYPDLFLNRGTVQSHLEDYQLAIKDLQLANEIDPTLNQGPKIEMIKKRMQFTKSCFERTAEIKPNKIQEIIKNIPNSIKQNKDKCQIKAVKQLKQRYNPNKMLSAKVWNKISGANDIPESFLVIDCQGTFLSVSFYNVGESLSEKIKKQTLITIQDPELKKVTFGNFSYYSVQVFELVKVWANGSRLTKNEFKPNIVYNEAFQK